MPAAHIITLTKHYPQTKDPRVVHVDRNNIWILRLQSDRTEGGWFHLTTTVLLFFKFAENILGLKISLWAQHFATLGHSWKIILEWEKNKVYAANVLYIQCTMLLTQIMTHRFKSKIWIVISLKYFNVYIQDFASTFLNTKDLRGIVLSRG